MGKVVVVEIEDDEGNVTNRYTFDADDFSCEQLLEILEKEHLPQNMDSLVTDHDSADVFVRIVPPV